MTLYLTNTTNLITKLICIVWCYTCVLNVVLIGKAVYELSSRKYFSIFGHGDLFSTCAIKDLDLYLMMLRANHTARTHESRRNYAHILVSARSVRRMRNSSVDRTWTVSDCKWICVEGGLCVILSFGRLKKIPTHNCALFMRRRA